MTTMYDFPKQKKNNRILPNIKPQKILLYLQSFLKDNHLLSKRLMHTYDQNSPNSLLVDQSESGQQPLIPQQLDQQGTKDGKKNFLPTRQDPSLHQKAYGLDSKVQREEMVQKIQENESSMNPDFNLFDIEKKRKKQKYKRSTNNSHKKFISAIRRLFYTVISTRQKQEFEEKYIKFRSCRTFFFIILAYMKSRFTQRLLNTVKISFINEMKSKIGEYHQQINRTKNKNLKNFREEEIIDIKYSINSCIEYFKGNTRQAIQSMYRKDKSTVVKRQHFQSALRTVLQIEKGLRQDPRQPLEEPYMEEFSPSSNGETHYKKIAKKQAKQHVPFSCSNHLQYDPGNYSGYNIQRGKEKQGPTMPFSDDQQEVDMDELQFQKPMKFFFPPVLEPVPFQQFNPFRPHFKISLNRQTNISCREDFFGFIDMGFSQKNQR